MRTCTKPQQNQTNQRNQSFPNAKPSKTLGKTKKNKKYKQTKTTIRDCGFFGGLWFGLWDHSFGLFGFFVFFCFSYGFWRFCIGRALVSLVCLVLLRFLVGSFTNRSFLRDMEFLCQLLLWTALWEELHLLLMGYRSTHCHWFFFALPLLPFSTLPSPIS